MTIKILKLTFAAVIFILAGCVSTTKDQKTVILDSLDVKPAPKVISSFDTMGKGLPIFYNMYLSVELSSLFQTVGAVYKPDLMNSPDRISSYLTSSQQAINLGIYAVDLSYSRVFDQVEEAGRYFKAMQQLSHELGIPDDYFKNTAERFERNIATKDSLIKIANEVYVITDKYLKENERYNTAALIILGGWTEAVYIALDVAVESCDADIIERLIDQKYSLNNVMIMLSEQKNNEVISGYLTELSKIKTGFAKLNINFDSKFDPNTPQGKEIINNSIQQLEILRKSVDEFRNEMIK
jgi:hypothetical protein